MSPHRTLPVDDDVGEGRGRALRPQHAPRVDAVPPQLAKDGIAHAIAANLGDEGGAQAQARRRGQRVAAVAAALRGSGEQGGEQWASVVCR